MKDWMRQVRGFCGRESTGNNIWQPDEDIYEGTVEGLADGGLEGLDDGSRVEALDGMEKGSREQQAVGSGENKWLPGRIYDGSVNRSVDF